MQADRRTSTIAFVIPTRNRRDDLTRMLTSLAAQTRVPDQLVVVDGSDEGQTIEDVVRAFPQLAADYVRVYPPSLARQRNAGIAVVRPEMDLAGYLDDDLVLEPDCVAAMMRFWERADAKVGGASFNITNIPRPPVWRFKHWIGIDSARPGAVLASGYNSMICPVDSTLATDWLFGGATVWRRAVIDQYPYDEWFIGTGFLEDLDYSHRVRQAWQLWVVADARLEHLSPPIRPSMQYRIGQWEVVNRLYFVRKHPHLSRLRWALALSGQLLIHSVKLLLSRDQPSYDRIRGNLSMIPTVLSGKAELPRLGGVMK